MSELESIAANQLKRIQELQRENVSRAAWAVLTSRADFVELFKEHRSRAQEAMRLMMSMPVHGMLADGTPQGVEVEATDALIAIRSGLTHSLLASVAALTIAMVAAYAVGAVRLDLPADLGKCLQTAGAAFALWGTLLAVGGPEGVSHSIPRRTHAVIYTGLLSFGGALAMSGTLI